MDNSEVPIVVEDNEPNDKDGDGVNVDDNQKFKKKKTSVVWDHFTTILKKESEINYKPKASCNYCGQVYAVDSNLFGTSSMRTHFQKLCREEDEVDVAHKVENDDEFEGEEEREMWEREIMIPETEKEKGKGRGKSVSYGTPNSDDWKVVELYVEVLRVFFVVTERFEGSLYVTSNTFFKEVMTIKKAIATLEKSDDPKLVMLANGMNKKDDKALQLYEMRSIQYAEEHNVGESRNMEKNAKGSFDYCDEMESDFESFMQSETNMVAKSELERYWSENSESNEKKDEDGKPEFNVLGPWMEIENWNICSIVGHLVDALLPYWTLDCLASCCLDAFQI
ncbi:hypothetical protein Vadar_012622 [Vaccinium darrowii]|uniref:Uncharacterized protein n=1 Tax=Vaccinium darrowii TaxID=229202 RepID=A0ACB7XZB6_9ERIC|nr:hypothetical protein Vadar_012622 [Vaccinium darrowii]